MDENCTSVTGRWSFRNWGVHLLLDTWAGVETLVAALRQEWVLDSRQVDRILAAA
jgi:hypothetical protein